MTAIKSVQDYRPDSTVTEYRYHDENFSYYWYFFIGKAEIMLRIVEIDHIAGSGRITWEFPVPPELMENLNYSDEDIDFFMQKVNNGNYTWQEIHDLKEELELKFDKYIEDVFDLLDDYQKEQEDVGIDWSWFSFSRIWGGKIFGQIKQALSNLFNWNWLKENFRFTGLSNESKAKIEEREKEEAEWRKRLKARIGRFLNFQ